MNKHEQEKAEMRERYKFILNSYRPDGADSNDPDFAEALQMAAEDRELGAWLAAERAHDAMFAHALQEIELPEGLKEEILSVLEYDGAATEHDSIDGDFIGALASISPPEGLREQILSAMEMESNASASEKVVAFPMWKWASIAVAALVTISFIIINVGSNNGDGSPIAMHELQLQGGNIVSASYEMDVTSNQLTDVNDWFAEQNYPVASDIPKGLAQTAPQGGKKIIINGIEVSVVFFEQKQMGKLFLLIIDSKDVKNIDDLAELGKVSIRECRTCPRYDFTVVSWRKGDKAYMLLTKADTDKVMRDIF